MLCALIRLIFQIGKAFENISRLTWMCGEMGILMLMEVQVFGGQCGYSYHKKMHF